MVSPGQAASFPEQPAQTPPPSWPLGKQNIPPLQSALTLHVCTQVAVAAKLSQTPVTPAQSSSVVHVVPVPLHVRGHVHSPGSPFGPCNPRAIGSSWRSSPRQDS